MNTTEKDNHSCEKDVFTASTDIFEVLMDPVFEDYGRLLLPSGREYVHGTKLGELDFTWYTNEDPAKTVEVLNTLRQKAQRGEKIFFDIYTEEEKEADPSKKNTGLFYFRGDPGMPFAICNAGGGFAYVCAIHDSFPHALELSGLGLNAFALIYRPNAQSACEDLARAVAFVFAHAEELQVDLKGYSLWGGSAGARMAAAVGSKGTAFYGEKALPKPAAVIMQYTGLSSIYGTEPPTYCCVGTDDWVDYRVMEKRVRLLRARGIDASIEVFPGLQHGFGLGTGTAAEGWLDNAAAFWLMHR